MTPGSRSTFRLQLSTANGLPAVAVDIATQTVVKGGSLTDSAEIYAAVVWERHCPGQELPPAWIQRLLPDRGTEFQMVKFEEVARYRLRGAPLVAAVGGAGGRAGPAARSHSTAEKATCRLLRCPGPCCDSTFSWWSGFHALRRSGRRA
jgi:hypothetical protein